MGKIGSKAGNNITKRALANRFGAGSSIQGEWVHEMIVVYCPGDRMT